MTMADGCTGVSEIITRSLVHLRTSKSPATRHREPGEEREFEIAPGVMMRMCWIPEGEFMMGSQLVPMASYNGLHRRHTSAILRS